MVLITGASKGIGAALADGRPLDRRRLQELGGRPGQRVRVLEGPGFQYFSRELHGAALSGNWRNSLLFFLRRAEPGLPLGRRDGRQEQHGPHYGPQCSMLPRARGQPARMGWYGPRDERCGCDDVARLLAGRSINFSGFLVCYIALVIMPSRCKTLLNSA